MQISPRYVPNVPAPGMSPADIYTHLGVSSHRSYLPKSTRVPPLPPGISPADIYTYLGIYRDRPATNPWRIPPTTCSARL